MRTLAFTIALVAAGAAPILAASAQTEYRQRCVYEDGKYLCRDEIETDDSVTNTGCVFWRDSSRCETKATPKGPPPAPTIERTNHGVTIMRGGPR